MMRKIISKILDAVLPPKEETASKEGAAPTKEVKTVSLEQILGGVMAEAPTLELLDCILQLKMKR